MKTLKFKNAEFGNKMYLDTDIIISEKGKRTRFLKRALWKSANGSVIHFNNIPTSYKMVILDFLNKSKVKYGSIVNYNEVNYVFEWKFENSEIKINTKRKK